MPLRNLTSNALIMTMLIAVASQFSCSTGQQSTSAGGPGASQTTATPAKVGFEADLEYVRKGQYTYVWVFARKDGKPFDKEDATYLRTNATQVVDWVSTDGGKRVIAGTNFDLALGNLELLKKRFAVEDYSVK